MRRSWSGGTVWNDEIEGEIMNESTKAKLQSARDYCNANDKSTEFMIQYMQDVAHVNFDCVMRYLATNSDVVEKAQP